MASVHRNSLETSSDNNDNIDRIEPIESLRRTALVKSHNDYTELYTKSISDPAAFWSEIADNFHWKQVRPTSVLTFNFDVTKGPIFTKWFDGARTNISYNLLDVHIERGLGDRIAFYWEGNHPDDYSRLTYRKLLDEVCRFANGLRALGVQKGDRVSIYMPMILETVVAMLACTRIGAIHSIVFAGFSAESLAERIASCSAKVLLTSDGAWRGEKFLNLKQICDRAMDKCSELGHSVQNCIVVAHLERVTAPVVTDPVPETEMKAGRDLWWSDVVKDTSTVCDPEWVEAEDPSFMLYTSGSTGKPKGVLHTTAGYMIYAYTTFKYVFDYHPNDIYWCTADIGWITGHTYLVYGPLANAATSVIYEGTPFYPQNDRFWELVDKYKVTQFYTAPTAIRALMKFGADIVLKHDLSSLKILGSVGEPINREAWFWYYDNVGRRNCSIVDTYWQTETGGHLLTPMPGATVMKPGSSAYPFFGVEPVLLDENGKEIDGEGEGYLVFRKPWPGIMRTLFNDHDRYEMVYFTKFPGYYCTGDGARRDADGYLWVTGRVDDMLNVSGHLMSTSEVESTLTKHKDISEAAVVSRPHAIKGECLYCFVTTSENARFDKKLQDELKHLVRSKIGPFAQPDMIQNAPNLPKTRSGKIMRRILKKVAVNDRSDLGDLSTLADLSVIDELFNNRVC